MDPIEIQAPDGSIVEFPAGTPDADIVAAMEAQFGAGGQEAPPPPADQGASITRDDQGGIVHRNTWQGVSDAQAQAYQQAVEAGEVRPDLPPGTNQNPYVIPEGMSQEAIDELVAEGVTFIDRDGRWQRKAHDLYGVYEGASRPVINTLNWAENIAGAVGGEGARGAVEGFRENLGLPTEEGNAELAELAADAGFRPGRGGQVAGLVGATAPLALATRNPWLLGAAEGALGSNAQDARGLAMDTGIGALLGKGADVTMRGVGSMVNPMINPAARALLDEGAELSPGQLAGGLAHRFEDATTGVPGIGEVTNAAQRRAEESVNRVAIQRPLSAIGVELPRNINSTHEAMDFAQRAVSDAYDELIPQLDVRLDQQFGQEFNALRGSVRNMHSDHAEMFERLIQNEVAPRFNNVPGAANGRITGESFKELESILGQEVRDFTASPNPHDRRYASAVRELQAQLRDMLARVNPQHAERLQSINDAYRQMSVIGDAVLRAPAGARGRFTPHMLEQAARNADPTVHRRASQRGDSLFMDLSQNAGEVMRRTVADSGTATRGAVTAGLGAMFLGQTMNISLNPWAVGALALGAVPYTRGGNRLFTTLMARRPEWAGRLRAGIDNATPLGALAASANSTVGRNEGRMNRQDANEIADIRNMVTDAQMRQSSADELEGLY